MSDEWTGHIIEVIPMQHRAIVRYEGHHPRVGVSVALLSQNPRRPSFYVYEWNDGHEGGSVVRSLSHTHANFYGPADRVIPVFADVPLEQEFNGYANCGWPFCKCHPRCVNPLPQCINCGMTVDPKCACANGRKAAEVQCTVTMATAEDRVKYRADSAGEIDQ